VVIILASLVLFRRECGLHWVCPVPSKMLGLLKYGFRYYLAKVSNMVNLQAGSVILAFFATRVEVGWFAIAARITQLVELLPDAMAAVLFPRSAGNVDGRSVLIARASRVIGAVCGVILVSLALFAHPLIRIVFSPEFIPAVPFVRILALGLIVRCMSKVLVAYLLGTDHPGIGATAVAVGAAVNLAAMWYLLPRVGVIGAPWGLTISYGISSAIILASFCRLSGISLRELFTFRRSDWLELGKLAARLGRRSDRDRYAERV
jgi:O-antigen/teichoic acid export membrane protein